MVNEAHWIVVALLLAGVDAGCATSAPPALPTTAAATTQTAADVGPGLSSENEATIRRWYKGWEQQDWHPLDELLADDFTFSSAAGDDHISKSAFKKNCWETQVGHLQRVDIQQLAGNGDEALVLYAGMTKNGKTFRNVEHLRLKDGKIEAIECYFGAQNSFQSTVDK
jgi:ketosteroid isomerase-like protein